jgi:hypothetical protein
MLLQYSHSGVRTAGPSASIVDVVSLSVLTTNAAASPPLESQTLVAQAVVLILRPILKGCVLSEPVSSTDQLQDKRGSVLGLLGSVVSEQGRDSGWLRYWLLDRRGQPSVAGTIPIYESGI